MRLSTSIATLQLLAEPTRVRLLALLEERELSVAELVAITALAQSSVSTHLGKLREAGMLRDRRIGASTQYSLNDGTMPEGAKKLWATLRASVSDAILEGDRERSAEVIRAREQTNAWPDAVAGQMERHYSPGRTWEAAARGFLGLMALGDVLDMGAGDGTLAELIAPRTRTITCVDRNAKMVSAGRQRLERFKHASVVEADAQHLPFADASFDTVMLFNVLTQVDTPRRVVAEAGRVLRAGGFVAVVSLAKHERSDVTAAYRDVHAGFSPAQIRHWLRAAGLSVDACGVTSRERRLPHFEVITAFARKAEKI